MGGPDFIIHLLAKPRTPLSSFSGYCHQLCCDIIIGRRPQLLALSSRCIVLWRHSRHDTAYPLVIPRLNPRVRSGSADNSQVRHSRTISYHVLVNQIDLLFLGTGTSAGVPMIGCYCDVCTSSDPRDQRTRPSVLISYKNTKVLIDTTPELRLQCVANRIDSIDAIVYTHAHADHIMGLDDVRRFNALRNTPLDVWSDQRTHDSLLRS